MDRKLLLGVKPPLPGLTAFLMLSVAVVGGARAQTPGSGVTPAPPAPNAPQASAAVKKAEGDLERVLRRRDAGVASSDELLAARLTVADARFRQAVARGRDADAVACLETTAALWEGQVKVVLELQKAAVISAQDVNAVRVAAAQARVRVGLYTLVLLRKADRDRALAQFRAAVITAGDRDAAVHAYDDARKHFEDAEAPAAPKAESE